MTTLYNCKREIDREGVERYRITKFDGNMDVESSYLTTHDTCDCPAGQRPTCRHRDMLPKFINRGTINTEWFYDFDRGGWVQMGSEWAQPEVTEEMIADTVEYIASDPQSLAPLPDGIVMVDLDDGPEAVWNAIADAIGEPRHQPRPTAANIKRRV